VKVSLGLKAYEGQARVQSSGNLRRVLGKLGDRRRLQGVVAGLVLGVLITTGIAVAAVKPSITSTTIHGCVSNKTGVLTVLDTPGASCDGRMTAVSWNTTGPAGSGFQWRGAWKSGSDYALDDVVRDHNGSTYLCHSAVGSSTKDPARDPEHFVLFTSVGATGPKGVTGPKGATGLQGATGSPGLVFLGAWSDTTAYVIGDVVSYNGSSYVASATNTDVNPSNNSDWGVLASAGAAGSLVYYQSPTGFSLTTGSNLVMVDAVAAAAGVYYASATVQLLGAESPYQCSLWSNTGAVPSLGGSAKRMDEAVVGVSSIQTANPMIELQGGADLASSGWIMLACFQGGTAIEGEATIDAVNIPEMSAISSS